MTVFVNLFDIIALCIVVALILLYGVVVLLTAWQRRRCKHKNYFENRACNAICRDCGKDLGFIGSLRGKVK